MNNMSDPSSINDPAAHIAIGKLNSVAQSLGIEFRLPVDHIDLLVNTLVARESLVLVSLPGQGYSRIIKRTCAALSLSLFDYLVSPLSKSEDLFGFFDPSALSKGEVRRITKGMAQESHVLFLDNAFEMSSSVMNTLITLIENDDIPGLGEIKTQSVILRAHTLPSSEDVAGLSLLARIPTRLFLPLKTDGDVSKLLSSSWQRPYDPEITIDRADVDTIYRLLRTINVQGVTTQICALRERAQSQGVPLSDRHIQKISMLMRVSALRRMSHSLGEEDLRWFVFVADSPEKQKRLRAMLFAPSSSPDLQEDNVTLVQEPIDYEYEVALSFAGEDREYVEKVASQLRANGIRVFYDRYERSTLWGTNLLEHLADVYRNKSRLCVIFCSRHYAAKVWTTHERRNAQERAMHATNPYILPVRFDDTVIPGLLETVGYVDGRHHEPSEIVEMIREKLNTI